jgi:3-oxoacyl-[acyl-carrier-protein] synthase II
MTELVDSHGRPRVVVTGMGVKTPAGVDPATLWERVQAGKGTAKRIERFDPSELPVRFAGEVLEYEPEAYFGPKEIRRVDRFTQLGFGAAADAIADAGELGADPSRVAVIAATGVGGLETMEENEATFLARGPSRVSPFFVPMMMPNAAAGLISIRFGFTGAALCISTACAAGANAIGEGLRMVRDGSADIVVAGATEAPVTPLTVSAFARMGAMSTRNDDPASASRPFDAARDGFVIAEGSGFCVLETLEHALARGAKIHG